MKKIILFMSTMSPKAGARPYLCPDGERVEGTQTNEAPVKYLLRRYGEEITGILCVVSKACKETLEGKAYSTLEHFRRDIAQFCAESGLPYLEKAGDGDATLKEAFLKEIDFREDGGSDTEAALVRDVSRELNPGDEILLETTGGFRNSVMLLLMLSRVLSYTGHPTACAVYSFFDRTNQGKDKIFDVSDIAGYFDLIGGMQELTSFGNVRALRAYYRRRPHDKRIDRLLDAAQKLLDTIALCRTKQIPGAVERFNRAMDNAEACADPLLPQLLPAFREKFGGQMDIPGLIRWCVDSDMVQQALTIYKENIPGYLLQRGGVLRVDEDAPLPEGKQEYQSNEEAFFRDFVERKFYKSAIRGNSWDWRPDQYAGYRVLCGFEAMRRIALDYNYILLLRNMTNHAADTVGEKKEWKIQELNDYNHRFKHPKNTTAQDVKDAILSGLKNLNVNREGKE
ncbi:MAG: TM1812 family CRISPR-associated protein [Oscillibacter sp.]|nr:TM1812 family CRISPR-associated protein [Oscillibacter sp.]